jgi:glycosyltransferase involved in cell wall biosynthesis
MARSVALLARHLPAHAVEVHVVVHRDSPLTAALRDRGTSVEVVPELIETGLRGPRPTDRGLTALVQNLRRAPVAVRKLLDICVERQAGVLYSHGTWSNYLAAAAGMVRSSLAVVWHVRNDHSAFALRTAGRWLAQAVPVRSVIAVSQSAAAPYAGISVAVEVVHNGVDFEETAREPRVGHGVLPGLAGNAVVVGFAGRLTAPKGIRVLMEAFRLAVSRCPRLQLVVLGGSPRHAERDEVAALRDQALAWGLDTKVRVLGYVPDPAAFIQAFDLCVVPSTCRDACPRSAIEALASGVPVVGSAIGGIPEIVSHDVTGWLVPAGAPDLLADALVALGTDDQRRRAMGRAAAAERGRFDSRVVAARVADILRAAAVPAGSG